MPIPAVITASIISAGAGAGAAVYANKSAGKANRRAQEAEERSLDKQLAATKAANDEALEWERDVENRRRYEWDQEQEDERRQWDWYQDALEPYRNVSTGALGSLAQLVERLGGGRLNLGAPAPPRASSAPPDGWSPSSMVRTAAEVARGSYRPATTAYRRPVSTKMPVADPTAPLVAGAGAIADLLKNLPPSTKKVVQDVYADI